MDARTSLGSRPRGPEAGPRARELEAPEPGSGLPYLAPETQVWLAGLAFLGR